MLRLYLQPLDAERRLKEDDTYEQDQCEPAVAIIPDARGRISRRPPTSRRAPTPRHKPATIHPRPVSRHRRTR